MWSRAFVRLRWVVVILWVGGAAWAAVALPPVSGTAGGSLKNLLPPSSAALRAEQISSTQFAFPLLSRTVIVVRNPRGLPLRRQLALVDLALRVSTGRLPGYHSLAGALPLINGRREASLGGGPVTTAVLYLLFRPSTSSGDRTAVARRLLHSQVGHRAGEFEGVTGEVPAQAGEEQLISGRLVWVELATLVLVALAVGVFFRAVGAAVLTLAAVIGAYLVADRVVAQVAHAAGFGVPTQVRPLMVVLVFGVATDYSVFFLSRYRRLLQEGAERREAAARVVREISPIVLTAGITVAAGTAALLVARLGFVRAFGPALAVTVLLAMLVAVTFIPAALAVGGRRWFWPGWSAAAAAAPAVESGGTRRFSVVRLAARHPLIAGVLAVAVILGAGSGLRLTAVGNEVVTSLPRGAPVRRAYEVARRGFPAGVLAPAVAVVTGPGAGSDVNQLWRLQGSLERQPGVAKVLGPRQPPRGLGTQLRVWRTTNAARFLVFLKTNPLGSAGIAAVRGLSRRLPDLARRAGLVGVNTAVAGDSALSGEIVHDTLVDLLRVTPTILIAIFLVMSIFLRALVAPIYLVLTSVLAAGAALGLTTYVMQDLLGYGQMTYYAIFTVAVLLISLGSDYNVFLVGRIWQAGRRVALREAVTLGGSRAARPIATAAFILSLSFALIVIVPLRPFREIGFAMAAGLLIDAFIVRAILVPALLVLVGPRSAWPGRRLRPAAGAAVRGPGPGLAERERPAVVEEPTSGD